MAPKNLKCVYCDKDGFKSKAALNSHIKAVHPTQQSAPDGIEHLNLPIPVEKMGQGFHKIEVGFYIDENNHLVTDEKEIPKPPSSSNAPKRTLPKLGVHPVSLRARLEQRRREDGSFKNTVAMLGTHGRSAPKMPWHEVGINERWLLNDAHSVQNIQERIDEDLVDRWFQMHNRWRFTRRITRYSDDHWTWLQETTVPRIVMQRHYADIPNSEAFPLREVCEMFIGNRLPRGAGYVQQYFTNTFSYMIAQVMYEKALGIMDWERIEIYGCELEQVETEYFRQRPGMEWWLGAASQMGIEVYFPHDTFIAYAQDLVEDPQRGRRLVNYSGYMAYGYKSPSMEEAKAQGLPLGVDPIEENLIGSWEDYYPWFITEMNEGLAQMTKAHDLTQLKEDTEALYAYETERFADGSSEQ